jgi:hypothetical protein
MLIHTDRARAVARETGWDIDDLTVSRGWAGMGVGPVGQHRDSDALERSNYRVILEDLSTRFGDDVGEASFGHWGVGWVEEITWNAGNAELADAVAAWEAALADYPVADDEDHSALELEGMVEWCDSLRLEGYGRHGVEHVVSPLVEGDFGERLASLIFERFSATRPDDAPGEDILADAAIDVGLLVPSADGLEERFEDLETQADALREAIADHARGLLSDSELYELAAGCDCASCRRY